MELTTLAYAIALPLIIVYLYFKWKYTYWKRVGLPYLEPTFPFGNGKEQFLDGISFTDQFDKLYKDLKSRGLKHGGVYVFSEPFYLPLDIEILKFILQTDFGNFVNHGTFMNEKDDPLSGHLFNLEDEKWRNMRVKLTPTFTSGKMKMMFQTMISCTTGLNDILKSHQKIQDPVDIKDVVSRFTTDVIGSCAFGLDCNSLKDPNSEFRLYGKKIFDVNIVRLLKVWMLFLLPKPILSALKMKDTRNDVEKFFMKIIKDTIQYREENNVRRKDFMQLMIELKNSGQITDDDFNVTNNGNNDKVEALSINELAAQCFVFFVAGFETSGTTMTFALLELALNQDVQDKLRKDINNVLQKYDGKVTYDAVMDMKYLDRVINETLRKHAPIASTPRVCNKACKIPGTDVTLEKGVKIQIPISGIHHDPEYYPDPEKFDPDRFTEENKAGRSRYAFLPFGEGPRLCIGFRFGLLQAKIGVLSIIRNYKVTVNSKTKTPIKYSANSFVTAVEGGVWLDVQSV